MRRGVRVGEMPLVAGKEVWPQLLGYNLIRRRRGQAAGQAGWLPWQVSCAGAVQTVVAFAPLAWAATDDAWKEIARQLLEALTQHRVNDRPGRCEPRAQKRRPQTYPLLNEPRDQARARLTARSCG